MYCQKCGAEIADEAIVCPKCGCATGNTIQSANQMAVPAENEISSAKTMSILSIVLGLLIPIAGWILGGLAFGKANSMLANGVTDERVSATKSLSIVGLVVSTIVFVVAFAMLL